MTRAKARTRFAASNAAAKRSPLASGVDGLQGQTGLRRQTRHQIETLHALARLSFNQIIDRAHQHQLTRPIVNLNGKERSVRVSRPFCCGVGTNRQDGDTGMVAIHRVDHRCAVFRC